MSTAVTWFRRDLRLRDHPAPRGAVSRGVVPPLASGQRGTVPLSPRSGLLSLTRPLAICTTVATLPGVAQ